MRIKIFAAALVLLPVVALAQSPPPPTNSDAPKVGTLPGLEQFMNMVRTDHAKLWLAGKARNWELAAYQIAQMKELLSTARKLIPTYRQLPIGRLDNTTMEMLAGPLADLEKMIDAKDLGNFSVAYDKLTEACNSCHETAHIGFIVMRRPVGSTFTSQDFEPRKQRGTAPK